MASVVFDHIVKKYGNNPPVVKDLCLRIEDKEFLVLVGPSGCGKSTALRMIAGLEEISAGSLSIGEQIVNNIHPKYRDAAMVFQNYALYPHMSCYDNIAFALKLRKLPKDEIRRRVMNVAKILEIDHLLERKPKALSGGQRQRIAIGRAIVREPKVFLMDEPLSNLDAKLRVSMRAEMKRLHQRLQTTIVYVTHDQIEAMTLGDRIAIMKGGDLQQCDTPHQVYHNPASLFVATFIGSPPMNLLFGTMSFEAGHAFVRGSNFQFAIPVKPSYRPASVVVGIRPEYLRIASPDEPYKLSSTVEVTESMGFESYIYLTGEKDPIVCRVTSAQTPSVGETLHVTAADPSNIHIFDPSSEYRLT